MGQVRAASAADPVVRHTLRAIPVTAADSPVDSAPHGLQGRRERILPRAGALRNGSVQRSTFKPASVSDGPRVGLRRAHRPRVRLAHARAEDFPERDGHIKVPIPLECDEVVELHLRAEQIEDVGFEH